MFYRHWLELRWRWCTILVMSILIGIGLPSAIAREVAEFERTGKLASRVQPYSNLLEPLGAENLHLWAALVFQAFGAMLYVALFIFIFNMATSAQLKDYLLLTLPVSRQRALWTRFAVECLELGFAAAMMLALAALQTGHPLPWNVLLLSCGMAWLGTLPLLAAMKCITLICRSWGAAAAVSAAASLPFLIVAVRIAHSSLDVALDRSLISSFVLWSTLGLGVFCSLTAYAAHEREY
jgi:hypothetical protein